VLKNAINRLPDWFIGPDSEKVAVPSLGEPPERTSGPGGLRSLADVEIAADVERASSQMPD